MSPVSTWSVISLYYTAVKIIRSYFDKIIIHFVVRRNSITTQKKLLSSYNLQHCSSRYPRLSDTLSINLFLSLNLPWETLEAFWNDINVTFWQGKRQKWQPPPKHLISPPLLETNWRGGPQYLLIYFWNTFQKSWLQSWTSISQYLINLQCWVKCLKHFEKQTSHYAHLITQISWGWEKLLEINQLDVYEWVSQL